MKIWILALLATLVGMNSTARADELWVPSQYPTIQGAIDAALDGDEVVIEPGTYFDTELNTFGKAITIRSTDPTDRDTVWNTVLINSGVEPALKMVSGEGRDTVINGITFFLCTTSGYAAKGGGIRVIDSDPTVLRCIFSHCEATQGGGMYCENSGAWIDSCEFIECHNAWYGSALMLKNANRTRIVRCRFADNYSGQGSAIALRGDGNAYVAGCEFTDNRGITVVTVIQASDQTGDDTGMKGRLNLMNCTFLRNQATVLAAIASKDEGPIASLLITNSLIAGSSVSNAYPESGDGGLLVSHAPGIGAIAELICYNVTIAENTGTPQLLWRNGWGSLAHKIIFYGSAATGYAAFGNPSETFASVFDPIDIGLEDQLGPDGLPGTGDEDYTPQAGSQLIDAGINRNEIDWADLNGDGLYGALNFDLLLNPGPIDDPDVPNVPTAWDIGAIERQPPSCEVDLNGDGSVDTLDFLVFLNLWVADDPAADFNGDGTVDTLDFLVFLNAWVAGC